MPKEIRDFYLMVWEQRENSEPSVVDMEAWNVEFIDPTSPADRLLLHDFRAREIWTRLANPRVLASQRDGSTRCGPGGVGVRGFWRDCWYRAQPGQSCREVIAAAGPNWRPSRYGVSHCHRKLSSPQENFVGVVEPYTIMLNNEACGWDHEKRAMHRPTRGFGTDSTFVDFKQEGVELYPMEEAP